VVIPHDILEARVYFSGINFFNPGRTTFAYRIKEQHKEWISLGSRNSLPIIGFPPGTYTLEIKAANEDGLWSLPVDLSLIFLPRWYQTLWFRALLILSAASVLYMLYNYRIGQLKKMMHIRTKISQDLHDDVGSSLSGIGLMSEIAKGQLENENIKGAKLSLDKISSNAGEVLTMMSDIVWAINPKNDTFEKIITRLKTYADNVTTPQGIGLHFEVEKELHGYNLPMSERKNIYLICKEAIYNATRYAQCRNIYFYLDRTDRHILIRIVDDGKGFDTHQAYAGNGLNNMKGRSLDIKAKLKIISEKNKGTSIEIQLKTT
jgi:nitrate/nitrite-specific signal transduction histidine kinase